MAKVATNRDAVIPALAEAFRAHGFEGASMAVLQQVTGLGRGSLYNFFPGGKDEMAQAVLANIDDWFRQSMFGPLRAAAGRSRSDAHSAITEMFATVTVYFQSGQRVCLPGAFAVGRERDRFVIAVTEYFAEWVASLSAALVTLGKKDAAATAVRVVAAVQGAIVVSRALGDDEVFVTVLRATQANALAED